MSYANRRTYIICAASSGTESGSMLIDRVCGTEDQVKQYMFELLKEDRATDADHWESGVERIEDVEVDLYTGRIVMWANYGDYHIDYNAVPQMEPTDLGD